MYDWLIRNGTVVDGSGGEPFRGDVAVRGGRIARVAPCIAAGAARTLDLGGLVVAPGFIDLHRHADAALFRPGFGEAELRQGITTIVNGNCGMSVAPCPPAHKDGILDTLRPVTGTPPQNARLESFGAYLAQLAALSPAVNVGMLVGSGTLRAAVCGFARGLGAGALAGLHGLLCEAVDAGALGVSAGLSYLPDALYDTETMAAALAPMKGTGLPLVVHVRGEGDILYESVAEALDIAARLDAPLHISHYKCIGRRNWRAVQQKTTGLLRGAVAAGRRVSCDAYPWTAGSTQMACLLPPAILEGGFAQAAARLRQPEWRARTRALMEQPAADFENIVHSMGWGSITVAGVKTEKNRRFVGLTVEQLAAATGKDPYNAAFDLLADEGCDVAMVDEITCEADIRDILRLPFCSIISDAVYPDGARLHPRNYANIPRVFGEYVAQGVLTLPEAVRKLTHLPAATLGLHGRGLVKPGYAADLVVFDPTRLACNATYLDPARLTTGMALVLVNGQAAVEKDRLACRTAGQVLHRAPHAEK